MRNTNAFNDEKTHQAAKVAIRGAGIGALKYGAVFLPLSIIGQQVSPLYRGLTVQFKLFLVMGGMIVGGAIEGDRRMREYVALTSGVKKRNSRRVSSI